MIRLKKSYCWFFALVASLILTGCSPAASSVSSTVTAAPTPTARTTLVVPTVTPPLTYAPVPTTNAVGTPLPTTPPPTVAATRVSGSGLDWPPSPTPPYALPANIKLVWKIEGLDQPCSVAVDWQGNVYIVSFHSEVIRKYDQNGKFLTSWTTPGNVIAPYQNVGGIAVDGQDNIFVTDPNKFTIFKFDPTGKLITSWGGKGTGDSQFQNLARLAVDGQGNVYVLDEIYLKKFDNNGRFLARWGQECCQAYDPNKLWFNSPVAIAVGRDGTILVNDWGSSFLHILDRNGNLLRRWNSFWSAQGVAVDQQGNVYLADSGNKQILKFDQTGKLLNSWDTLGDANTRFGHPQGLAVDPQGNVYEVDSQNNQVLKFQQN